MKEKKREKKDGCEKKKKLERRTLALSPGENKPTTKQFLLHPKPFWPFSEGGEKGTVQKKPNTQKGVK